MQREHGAQNGRMVCIEPVSFDWPQAGQTRYIHPGTVVRAGHPWTRGREQFFRPLVLVIAGEPDGRAPLPPIPVAVERIEQDAPLAGWTWAKIKVRAPEVKATAFNVGAQV